MATIDTNMKSMIVKTPTDAGASVSAAKIQKTTSTSSAYPTEDPMPNEFAQAIYGDGQYSLIHPNNTTDEIAVNIDYIA